jgi:hypothetical protein
MELIAGIAVILLFAFVLWALCEASGMEVPADE